jgi:uncharacterized membrane protein YgcG
MKSVILLSAFAALTLGSCTTAYKTSQTPDDVYFSPAKPQDEYISTRSNDDRKYRGDEYDEDRYLRMRVRDRYRWSQLDDWYSYERYNLYYNFEYTYSWQNPWSPYSYWNYLYNPYCRSCCFSYGGSNPKSIAYNKPRTVNLNPFQVNTVTTTGKTVTPKSSGWYRPNSVSSGRPVNNNNTNSSVGNTLRNLFSSGSSNSGKNSGSTTSGSGSNSSSGSSGSSGSAPVRKF